MSELKPCPFCGGKASISKFRSKFRPKLNFITYYVECRVCRVRTSVELEEERAIEVWNRRAEDGMDK